MKIALIIILITLGFSTSISGRKISVYEYKNLMLVGFWEFHESSIGMDSSINNFLQFDVHFIRDSRFPKYSDMNMSTSILLNNNTEFKHEFECMRNNYNETELEDLSYTCVTSRLNNLLEIKAITPIVNFKFYNDNNSVINVTEKDIDNSSFVDTTIKTLINLRDNIDYDIFYLNKIELKNKEFTLRGNLTGNYTEARINLTLSGTKYNAFVTNESIKFNVTENIDDFLHGKMQESTNEGKYILIYTKKGIDDHLIYPVPNKFIEVLGFGNYQKPTEKTDAQNQLYLSGTQYSLNSLKLYIKFYITIYFNIYNGLTNLKNSSLIVEANGTLVENNQEKDLAIYNITYFGTANKTILRMVPLSNLEFSDDGIKYEKSEEEITIPSDTNLLEEEIIIFERMAYINNETEKNSTSFSLDFNTSERLKIENQSNAYIKYHPDNNKTKIDLIKCSCKNQSTYYRIICFPKKDVYTTIQTIIIIITEKRSNRRLRFLQSETNRTILPPTNANGIINFTYDQPKINFKRSKGGLSAGAIVALILATVFAVVAIGFAILFLNKIPASPPPIRTPTDMNLSNSTSNINH